MASDNPQAPTASTPSSTPRDVDILIHAEWLVPMDRERRLLRGHSLAIKDHAIVDVVETGAARQRFQARREYDLPGHALLPGLINAHGHSPMTLFRGFADDMPLQPWLEEKIWPAEGRWVSEEFVYDGARIAIAEMLLGGTTCFSDMYFFPDHVARAAVESRMRAQLAAPVLDFPTVWAANADEYIHKATLLHDEYRNSDLIHAAFGPHAIYTVSDAPLQKLGMLAEEMDIPVHIHLHENMQEITDSVNRGRRRPLQHLDDLGLVTPRLQAVHMTQLQEREIELLAAQGASVVHCPASNLKLANGFCPVSQLLAAGVNVCLGTDGAASNNDLDMLNEMHLAALMAKNVAADAAAVSAWEALEMATINGARALGLEQCLGSLEAGKFADVVAIDLERINSQPVYDPVSTLAYSVNASQVSHVWVGGQLNVENRELKTLDLPHLLERARHWADRIRQD